jgi:hypothetical protein
MKKGAWFARSSHDWLYFPYMKFLKIFIAGLIAVFLSAGWAAAFEAELTPGSVKQGDPFLVKVKADVSPDILFQDKTIPASPCGAGCFVGVGAVDVDLTPGTYNVFVLEGEDVKTLKLRVTKGLFQVTHITVDEDKVMLSPEDEKRADREAEEFRAIWPKVSGRMWNGGFSMPLRNSYSTYFGTKRIFNNEKTSVHTGLDIRGRPGEKVRAANRGRVVLAKNTFFGGNTIVLDHGDSIYTIYMHLEEFEISPGDEVKKGQVIGLVGSTGRATGPHLHFGVKVDGVNVNPEAMTKLPLYGL